MNRRRGLVLIIVLIVIVFLSLGAYTFSDLMITHHAAAQLAGRQLQTRYLVDSGVDYVKLFLAKTEEERIDAGGVFDNPDTFRGALSDIGLDSELYDRALADIGTWRTVVDEHEELVRDTKAFGVPTIRLDGGKGPSTFGPVLSELPTDDDAVKLLEHVTWLMRYENFGEFKRERIDLDVPSAAAWRARQAAKAAEAAKG